MTDLPLEKWHGVIDTNLTGVFYCCRAAIPRMRRRGRGFIINIGSLAGVNPIPNLSAYNASRFGLLGFSQAFVIRDSFVRHSTVAFTHKGLRRVRPVEVVNRDHSAPFITKDRSEIRSILDRTNSTARNQSLAEATLPPGAQTEEHQHPRSEEIYYILRGRGLMTLEGERREVGPGDGILIPPGARHRIRNTGREPLVFLCCCAPPYSHEDTLLVNRGG